MSDFADIGAVEMQSVVVTNANDDGSAGSLRQTILNAPANSDILFDPAVFNVARTITLGGTELAINKNLTIYGPGANLLTISGNNLSRVFNVSAGFNVALSGLTITGGNANLSSFGGGILIGGTLTGGALAVTNSTISGNSAYSGGGIRNNPAGTLTVTNSTISGNTALRPDNDGGGGIDNRGTLTVTNSTISGNSMPNAAIRNGGGIYTSGAAASITNCTIANNSAGHTASDASGVFRASGTVTIRNSIIAGNVSNGSQPDVVSIDGSGITSNGFNLIGNPGAITFNGASDQKGSATPLNPQLGPLALNGGTTPTHALLGGSPALDAGNSSFFTTDQRGRTRAFDTPGIPNVSDSADIGAVEMQSVIVTNANDDASAGSLRQTILNAPANSDILFDPAFFNVARTITLGGTELAINKNLTINGPGASMFTVSGNNSSRVLAVNSGITVSLSGMTMTGGNSLAGSIGGTGGSILNSGTLLVTNSTISGNTGSNGGGIANLSPGALTVTNSTISGNTATAAAFSMAASLRCC